MADISEWKERALKIQREYYTSFSTCQWSEFILPKDKLLLRAKICFALYGPPTENKDNIEDLYDEKQKNGAEDIMEKILTIKRPERSQVKVGFIFVACKQEKNEYVLPVFRVLREKTNGCDCSSYVDTQCRIYSSWSNWKTENNLPIMHYAYPRSGYYTSNDGKYEFDPKAPPVIEYGESPSSDVSSQVLRGTDVVTSIVSLGCGAVAVAALFTPLAPAVLLTSAIAGGSAATYGAGRVIYRLYDKGSHGESLADLESMTLWFTIVAMPLNFGTSFMNGVLRGAAVNGRILSSSMRTFATILNFTTLGVDSVMLGFGLFNLIDKAKANQLNALDVAQFSMSVFFFTNTLMQPKVASQIIKQAQNQHINQYINSMTDEKARVTLEKFVADNNGQGTITDQSKVIRTINRIEDPNGFFKGVSDAKSVEIGGRKGKTVLVTDANGQTNRMNPNRVVFESKPPQGNVNFTKTYNGLKKCFGKDKLEDVRVNGQKIFDNMTERQKAAMRQAYEATARKNPEVVTTAHTIAEKLGCNNADQFASIIEIVQSDVAGLDPGQKSARLSEIRGCGLNDFVSSVRNDQQKANRIANSANLKFSDDLKAVYHYRKHGNDFPSKGACKIEFYLDKVPTKLVKDANLTEVIKLDDGTVRKVYRTSNDNFAVVTETPNGKIISTLFNKPDTYATFMEKLREIHSNTANVAAVKKMGELVAASRDYHTCHIYIGNQSRELKLLEHQLGVDPDIYQEIAQLLRAML